MARLTMVVLWPAFLAAILAEGFFFSLFDPSEISVSGRHMDLPVLSVYTIGFLFFWAFCALGSMLTCYLMQGPEPRQPPF